MSCARSSGGARELRRGRSNEEVRKAEDDRNPAVGRHWWPAGSKVKCVTFTAAVGFAFDPLVDFNGTGAGYLPDYTESGGETNDGQWLARTQLQFLF